MASQIGNTLQNAIGNLFKNTAASGYANVYAALMTAAPTNAGGGTECTGTGYARVAIPAANWTLSGNSPATLQNNAVVDYGSAGGANWGTIVAVAVYDAATVGNLLFWQNLTQSKTINNGDPVNFPANNLQFLIGN